LPPPTDPVRRGNCEECPSGTSTKVMLFKSRADSTFAMDRETRVPTVTPSRANLPRGRDAKPEICHRHPSAMTDSSVAGERSKLLFEVLDCDGEAGPRPLCSCGDSV